MFIISTFKDLALQKQNKNIFFCKLKKKIKFFGKKKHIEKIINKIERDDMQYKDRIIIKKNVNYKKKNRRYR